jgi:hypothetical protein
MTFDKIFEFGDAFLFFFSFFLFFFFKLIFFSIFLKS